MILKVHYDKQVNTIFFSYHYMNKVQDYFNPHLHSQKHHLGNPLSLRYSNFKHFHHQHLQQ